MGGIGGIGGIPQPLIALTGLGETVRNTPVSMIPSISVFILASINVGSVSDNVHSSYEKANNN
jgi:hypothetical protein